MQNNHQFDVWYFSQKSLMQPNFPMATEILYAICNGNESHFDRVNDYLQMAYEQGVKDGEMKCKQV